ncbi:MAG TPA: hypothetical protein VMG34_03210 [Bacteroidota bacterium]|nr:hypothetical protein [Bacteroidota bacterium]
MDSTSRLRRHLGESASLVSLHPGISPASYEIDFTRHHRGEEVTLLEVGGHGITVEYVASGHKDILPLRAIRVRERGPGSRRGRTTGPRTARAKH